MSLTVCIAPSNTISYAHGGGHFWVFLNWALGLRAAGCRVLWLEFVSTGWPLHQTRELVSTLRERLAAFGFADSLVLCTANGASLAPELMDGCHSLERATAEADLFLNFRYGTVSNVIAQFRRSALVDIDPGLLQTWVSMGKFGLPEHDVYFTIGETVGTPDAAFPDLGLCWNYIPPCVALDAWPHCSAAADAPFTTIMHWWAGTYVKDNDPEDKRSGFFPLLDLPGRISQPLELALDLEHDDPDLELLRQRGWRVAQSHSIAGTPSEYRRYIQSSRGEFTCAKPSYVRLQTAWVSDRSSCYLASGKPVVVQHTGPSRFLPDAEGIFRFRTMEDAVSAFEKIQTDYDRHSQAALNLAREYFDARKAASRLLERALP